MSTLKTLKLKFKRGEGVDISTTYLSALRGSIDYAFDFNFVLVY